MAKNIPLSTIGVKISYAVETVAGTRPTSGYTRIHGLYSTPDFNIAPSTADATSFDNEEYTTKIALLKDMPDTIEFGARFGKQFASDWKALVSAHETAKTANKEVWFCIDIPDYDEAIFFTGVPVELGLPSMEANSGIDTTAYVSPTGEPKYETKPTYTEA